MSAAGEGAPGAVVKVEGGSNPSMTQRRNRLFKKTNNPVVHTPKETKFEGRVESLNGYIFDCSYHQSDEYTKTIKEIAEYVGRTYKYGNDAKLAIEYLRTPVFQIPADPAETASRSEQKIWEKEIDEYVKRKSVYNENMKSAYSVVWGQCSNAMRAKLESRDTHENIALAGDVIGLLRNIKDAAFSFQSEKYKVHALHEAKRRFYSLYQDRNMTVQAYMEKFKNQVDVIEHCGGSVYEESLLADALEGIINPTEADRSEAKLIAKEQYMACAFILSSDRNRYGKLVEDLENNYIQKQFKYPIDMNEAYSLLMHWKQDPKNVMRVLGANHDGVAFATNGQVENKKDATNITCYTCSEKGHYASECPLKKNAAKTGNIHVQETANNTELTGNVHVQGENECIDFEDNITTSFHFCNQGEMEGGLVV
jgi:hypothetical protein